MNYPLSREIYGGLPWMVDRPTFSALSNLLTDIRSGVNIDNSIKKLNSFHLCDYRSSTKVVTDTGQLNSDTTDQMIYVINMNGPIIKNGGLSTYGMDDLVAMITTYQADDRIIGGVIRGDSGGGSQLGMLMMQYCIQTRTKPIVTFIPRAGIAASAMYGIASETDWIISESELNEVGSIGTMISFRAQPNKNIAGDGGKQITIYASSSTKKNLWFEEALNNDNYNLAITEVLNPANELFTSGVKKARPGVLDTQLDGSVYNSGDVLGSLVDEIGDMQTAFDKVIELSQTPKYNKLNKNKPNKIRSAMTAQELQQQHPTVYAEIFGAGKTAGIKTEKDRTGVFLAHLTTDPEMVKKGIESGEEMTATMREELLIKASSKEKLDALKKDSPKDVVPKESESKEVVPTEAQAFYAGVLKGMK